MIAVVDYGVGNLFSLVSSLKAVDADAVVTSSASQIKNADKIILPGVGAFEDAAKKLRESGLFETVKTEAANGKPLMGICLGMQLLFQRSFEYGEHEGLSLLEGDIISMEDRLPSELKIPHIGWNALHFRKSSPIFKYINEGDHVYFVHSYYAESHLECVTAVAEYGIPLTAAVGSGNVYGCQFHPEKSGKVGLQILRAFSEVSV